jgi:ligand-binding sensor domain-containing protein
LKSAKFIGSILLCALAFCARAQAPFFQNYSIKKNQPIQVNAFLQSKSGFLWIGSTKGLFRFDGIRFEQFDTTHGLAEEYVTTLAEDSVGRIWVGHQNGKISIFENKKARLFEPEEGLSSKPVSKILFDKRGILWFSTLNDGLYYYNRNNRLYRLDDIDGMPDIFVYDIAEAGDGNIWAATDGGLAVCSLEGKDIKINTISTAQGLPDNIVKKIKFHQNKAWLVTEDAGVVCYNLESGKTEQPFGQWVFEKPIDLVADKTGLWIATSKGVLSVAYETWNPHFFTTEAPTTLFEDRESNLWLGLKHGIARCPGNRIQFIKAPDEKKWDVQAVAVDKNHDIWFSTPDGLFKRDKNGIVQKQLTNTPFAKSDAISLYADEAGFVWAGLYDEGLLKINIATGQVSQIKEGLANGSVLHITGHNNQVWLATLGGASQLTLSGDKTEIKNYHSENGLSTDYIYQVFIDSQQRVWFATDRAGIDMLDQNGFHHYKGEINAKVIYGFAEDANHQVWANVQSSGLFIFDKDQFKPFPKQNNVRDVNINDIITNNEGEIVMAHDRGIDIYNPVSKNFSYYGEEAGIKDQSPNLNATFKDAQGRILIGTNYGLILLSSESFTANMPVPVIEDLDVYNQAVPFSNPMSLKYNQNNLTIRFIGLWYQNPENLNFRFKLENHDEDWIETHDHSTSYSQLPPGTYTFHVMASVSNDFEKAKEATITFTVRPPFWRTNMFYALVLALAIFGTYSFIKYRERKLKSEKLELERLVHERTKEIERNNEEIKAQAEEIQGINENLESLVQERTKELERKNKALEEYAFINAHQLRAPVASILGLLNLMKDIPLKDHEKDCMDHLQASAKKLDDVVSSITEAIERGDYDALPPPDSSEYSE